MGSEMCIRDRFKLLKNILKSFRDACENEYCHECLVLRVYDDFIDTVFVLCL